MEEARTEFFKARGISIKELASAGTLFMVVRQEVDYMSPAFYDDCLEVGVKIIDISKVRITFEHEVKNQNGKIICLGKTCMVCVDKNIRPKAISGKLKEKLYG
jgi:YbgC/YbaW family acyl-CoA thioester hydrolase